MCKSASFVWNSLKSKDFYFVLFFGIKREVPVSFKKPVNSQQTKFAKLLTSKQEPGPQSSKLSNGPRLIRIFFAGQFLQIVQCVVFCEGKQMSLVFVWIVRGPVLSDCGLSEFPVNSKKKTQRKLPVSSCFLFSLKFDSSRIFTIFCNYIYKREAPVKKGSWECFYGLLSLRHQDRNSYFCSGPW